MKLIERLKGLFKKPAPAPISDEELDEHCEWSGLVRYEGRKVPTDLDQCIEVSVWESLMHGTMNVDVDFKLNLRFSGAVNLYRPDPIPPKEMEMIVAKYKRKMKDHIMNLWITQIERDQGDKPVFKMGDIKFYPLRTDKRIAVMSTGEYFDMMRTAAEKCMGGFE